VPVDQAHDVLVDLAAEDHPDDVDHLLGGHAQARGEGRLDTQQVQVLGDLRPAAMDDDRAQPGVAQESHVLREPDAQVLLGHRVAAVLDHHGLAVEPAEPRQRLDQRGGLDGGGGAAGLVHALFGDDRHVEYAEFSWT